jgi:hypothetical protein
VHFEFLVEDSSGRELLEILLPLLLGEQGVNHSWRIHSYRGIGRLPKEILRPRSDAYKRILLDRLPQILRGLSRCDGVDAIVVLIDADKRPCAAFLAELLDVARKCGAAAKTMFRLAIEEIEAWYFGDEVAILEAYPKANMKIIRNYVPDSICDTWETLADAIVVGGRDTVMRIGGPHAGDYKHEWARTIGPRLSIERNRSPSFRKFCEGVRRKSSGL